VWLKELCALRKIHVGSSLSITRRFRVLVTDKGRWRERTSQAIFEPLEVLARLAALVPSPRFNWVRYNDILAPAAAWRSLVVPESETQFPCSIPAARQETWRWRAKATIDCGKREAYGIPSPALRPAPEALGLSYRTFQPKANEDSATEAGVAVRRRGIPHPSYPLIAQLIEAVS
jgi:hypothetical protein